MIRTLTVNMVTKTLPAKRKESFPFPAMVGAPLHPSVLQHVVSSVAALASTHVKPQDRVTVLVALSLVFYREKKYKLHLPFFKEVGLGLHFMTW